MDNNAISTSILKLWGLIPSLQRILISALFNVLKKKSRFQHGDKCQHWSNQWCWPSNRNDLKYCCHTPQVVCQKNVRNLGLSPVAKLSWCGKQAKIGKSEIVHWVSDRNVMNTSVLVSDPWCTHTVFGTYCWLHWYSSCLEEMLSYSLLALQRISSRICIISRIQSHPYHDLNLNQRSYGSTTCSL